MFGRLSVSVLFLFGGAAVAQQSAWGQCGGTGFSGDTKCASGYTCVALSDYYSQCQPGSASTTTATTTLKTTTKTATTTTSKATTTGGTGTATGPGTTLQSGWYWIRAVESPNFHYYLQTDPQYETGTAVLESYTTAGQFNVVDGQLVELISAPGATEKYLYANVATNTTHDGKTLAMSFETTKNTYGTFLWSGDALQWKTDDINRPNLSAWLVCEDQQLFINLGNYLYQTPSGCADETIHYYNDKTANGKRRKLRKH